MWQQLSRCAMLAALLRGVNGSLDQAQASPSHSTYLSETTVYDPVCTANVTVFDRTTFRSATTILVTSHFDVAVNRTETRTVEVFVTESVTTTLRYTVSTTETDHDTITETQTTTDTVAATITTYTTKTIFSTTFDPCPTTCSLSVGTVNLYFWPTDRAASYPSTYFDASLDYTFTSPSVYMLIPTAHGTNSLGRTGPSTSKWILPLLINEVSTIVDGSVTQQLHLSDLGTNCPQTADPSAIATLSDPRCDPILAAPRQVSSWAYPCNACGRFALFDPPYAVPTLTGGLVPTTTEAVTVTVAPATTTAIPAPTSVPPVGKVLIVTYSEGTPMGTSTVWSTGMTGTITSSTTLTPAAPTMPATSTLSSTTPVPVPAAGSTKDAPFWLALALGLGIATGLLLV